ncbi:UDP-N-acetylmuramoyl-L-alanine--D-glutamate ligase [Aliifodinibius sp. S!AR15-10]|uniref:UDP-N-acetylmuramoyl-L-alanine--D-glutamate ligase n=1 Tax=Aliifodinibius sp. S!AR15-10 TaxID=2950437 RepID=UPI00285A87FB|nr:UDP-N-acetylmuramoyl-L-alanine--D-glutamate ligase [Aliifodinibius sp. S!AR15-10]MDR8393885.1 UDP-N-acetylmuramoyl-L-alanine--D-glutamate ligase [Aliifodinibius sp. S!AR15-10]
MREVKDRHIVVIGAARSGMAVASLLHKKGAQVFVTEKNQLSEETRQHFEALGIQYEENGHTNRARDAEFAVLSPGVPTEAPLVQEYLAAGKKVYSELEVASWFNKTPIVAVTGSNGKTTVTSWLGHTWKLSQKKAVVAGNIGQAFSNQVGGTEDQQDVILEVSSFQLDHIDQFHPHVSLILNITPDHLDRYQNSIEKYAQSKFRITENQTADDWFIYHYDDPIVREHVEILKYKENAPRLLAFSSENKVPEGAFVRAGKIILKLNDKEEVLMPISKIGLRGKHNLNNGLATVLAARASEIKSDIIRESLMTFEGVEHRLELVRTIDGVKYINDSKATNINAVWYALDSYEMPMVLILGGRDKGNDYTELIKQVREKVHTIVAIGEAQQKIEEQLSTVVPNFQKADTMPEAVKIGRNYAKRGEIVMLSPACSSFDMFENYEHRGEVFKKAVNDL